MILKLWGPLISTAVLLLWIAFYIGNLYEKLNDRKNELELQSKHDGSTGLINRKSFLDVLQKQLSLAESKKQNVVLCCLNINDDIKI